MEPQKLRKATPSPEFWFTCPSTRSASVPPHSLLCTFILIKKHPSSASSPSYLFPAPPHCSSCSPLLRCPLPRGRAGTNSNVCFLGIALPGGAAVQAASPGRRPVATFPVPYPRWDSLHSPHAPSEVPAACSTVAPAGAIPLSRAFPGPRHVPGPRSPSTRLQPQQPLGSSVVPPRHSTPATAAGTRATPTLLPGAAAPRSGHRRPTRAGPARPGHRHRGSCPALPADAHSAAALRVGAPQRTASPGRCSALKYHVMRGAHLHSACSLPSPSMAT